MRGHPCDQGTQALLDPEVHSPVIFGTLCLWDLHQHLPCLGQPCDQNYTQRWDFDTTVIQWTLWWEDTLWSGDNSTNDPSFDQVFCWWSGTSTDLRGHPVNQGTKLRDDQDTSWWSLHPTVQITTGDTSRLRFGCNPVHHGDNLLIKRGPPRRSVRTIQQDPGDESVYTLNTTSWRTLW